MNKRHVAIYRILRPLAALFIHVRFRFRSEKPKNLPKQYMLLSNHATDYDPVLIASAFPEHMYFMGSEHIARWGFFQWERNPVAYSAGSWNGCAE